jgi:hypothetical protein
MATTRPPIKPVGQRSSWNTSWPFHGRSTRPVPELVESARDAVDIALSPVIVRMRTAELVEIASCHKDVGTLSEGGCRGPPSLKSSIS